MLKTKNIYSNMIFLVKNTEVATEKIVWRDEINLTVFYLILWWDGMKELGK